MRPALLMLDEVNRVNGIIEERMRNGNADPKQCEDDILDLLLLCYLYGNYDANSSIGTDIPVDRQDMFDSADKKIAGKTFRQRIDEYVETGDIESVKKVVETEAHRVFNQGSYSTAKKGGATTKRWSTVKDDRVRETHNYLEGMSVGINEKFYTFDGDSAYYPGGFDTPQNNINCRCVLEYSKQA